MSHPLLRVCCHATRESHYLRSWSLLTRTLLAYREQVVWVGVLQVRGWSTPKGCREGAPAVGSCVLSDL
jgi:hypothetical protein